MSLSVGIVGLPNVGKSTLFNALLKKQAAYAANFPFATIEPNIGIVPVPDNRLEALAKVQSAEDKAHRVPPIVPATVKFVDIAGLVAGAHKGEGLGNKFLSHIREVDAICHVVRAFNDTDIVREGSIDPKSDFEIIKTELELADYETVEAHKKKKNADLEALSLLSKKPILVVINIGEEDIKSINSIEERYASEFGLTQDQVIAVSAKVESELSELGEEDQKEYLSDIGLSSSGLERVIKKAFSTLGLITFLTAGEKEVRAWTLRLGETSLRASGVIHTDFMKKFIKADVVSFEDFIGQSKVLSDGPPAKAEALAFAGWKKCRELGKVRSEGRDYIVKDGDVIEFKIGA